MISRALALRLRDAGLRWRPAKGDWFQLIAQDGDGSGTEVFTVSDMTIEAHDYPTGTVLGFNGTTEWALDSVDLTEALWFPREDQLRDALRHTFERLERDGDVFRVVTVFRGDRQPFTADAPDEAYGLAVLQQVSASS